MKDYQSLFRANLRRKILKFISKYKNVICAKNAFNGCVNILLDVLKFLIYYKIVIKCLSYITSDCIQFFYMLEYRIHIYENHIIWRIKK